MFRKSSITSLILASLVLSAFVPAGARAATTDAPSITSFSASVTSATPGQDTNLSWVSTGADQCVLRDMTILAGVPHNEGGNTFAFVPSTGSFIRSSQITTTYRILCTKTVGSNVMEAHKDVTVTVTGGTPSTRARPSMNSFTASPTSVGAGAAVTLSWNVTGADRCTLFSGSTPLGTGVGQSGTWNVNPQTTTTYNLDCYRTRFIPPNIMYLGIGYKSATVTVH
jgi:hypothetical protein